MKTRLEIVKCAKCSELKVSLNWAELGQNCKKWIVCPECSRTDIRNWIKFAKREAIKYRKMELAALSKPAIFLGLDAETCKELRESLEQSIEWWGVADSFVGDVIWMLKNQDPEEVIKEINEHDTGNKKAA